MAEGSHDECEVRLPAEEWRALQRKGVITEYFQPTPETYGVRYMIVTTIIEDPEYLTGPLITSSNYKKLPDTNNGWDPQPCSVR